MANIPLMVLMVDAFESDPDKQYEREGVWQLKPSDKQVPVVNSNFTRNSKRKQRKHHANSK